MQLAMAGFFEMAADKEVVSGAIVKQAAVFDKFLQVRTVVVLSRVCHLAACGLVLS